MPIPIPADLVMLAVGERARAGDFSIWLAVLALEIVAVVDTSLLYFACRRPGRALIQRVGPRVGLTSERVGRAVRLVEERGRAAITIGRGTPGLRTVTVVATGGSGFDARRALPFLVIGSSAFLQAHLLLGYLLGPAARRLLDEHKGIFVIAAVAAGLVAIGLWVARRGGRAGVDGGVLSRLPRPRCGRRPVGEGRGRSQLSPSRSMATSTRMISTVPQNSPK